VTDVSLIRGRVLTPHEVIGRGWLALAGGAVVDAGDGRAPAAVAVADVGERIVAPGFVDLHVHGGDGAQAAGDDPGAVAAAVAHLARFHARHGTTTLVVATVSDTPDRLLATVAGIRTAIERPDPAGAAVAGVHLEGPWLAPARRGAHDAACLRRPAIDELDALVAAAGGHVRLLTIAPELEGATDLIAAAVALGITVSVGHTDASYDTVHAAFDAGARHVTHLGNAMPPLDRRQPGPVGAALTDGRVTVEVIADGQHVHPALLRLVAASAPERMVAVTDAVAVAGLPDGTHHLGRAEIVVSGGRVVLQDRPGTLAGSALTMDRAVGTLVEAGVPLPLAVRAATLTPAAVAGPVRGGRPRGALRPGYAADVVILDAGLRAVATIIGGRVVHDPAGLVANLGG
jgi:N-acetylglucosamine-6-phosphate deacetylase